MSANSNRNKDIKEIFLHVEKLKKEFELKKDINEEKFDSSKIIKDNTFTKDTFETVNEDETVTIMSLKNKSICDLCGQDIIFDENLSGLVIKNKFFACEECCKDASDEVLKSWIETRDAKTQDVKPIALWLMQVKNKTRLI